MRPLVSVVMPVYNGARDVPRAIASVFDQTFRDFELIVVNDGSQDETAAVLDSMTELADSRLRVVHLTRNVGVAAAVNHGIGLAQGDYIARHDHDDISRPTRLEQQVGFMQAHPECGLLGTRRKSGWPTSRPNADIFIRSRTPCCSLRFCLTTTSFIVPLSFPSAYSIQWGLLDRPMRQPPEDYELWSRIARQYEVRNLPEQLLIYREMPKSLSSMSARERAFSRQTLDDLRGKFGLEASPPSPSQEAATRRL